MTLADARSGDTLVVGSAMGRGAQIRLWDLGVIPGTVVQVIAAHPFRGPVLIKTGGTKVAVGRGLADSVSVRFAEPPELCY
ncbi:MAG: FeoA family protein [Bacillota bacterium]